MGKQTTPLIIGFISAHVATVLDIVGLVEPVWLKGEFNGTLPENTTALVPTKGLWKYCFESGNCTSLSELGANSTLSSTAKTMQGIDTSGTGFVFLALACAYIFFFCGKCHKSKKLGGFISFCLFASTALTVAAVIYFSQKGFDDATEFEPDYILDYGYAFYLTIAGAVISFLGFLFFLRVRRLMGEEMEGYESI